MKFSATGIALFTYHKYRKSIDSTVPLDAHGNPIVPDEDEAILGTSDREFGYELAETERLTTNSALDGFDEVGSLCDYYLDLFLTLSHV